VANWLSATVYSCVGFQQCFYSKHNSCIKVAVHQLTKLFHKACYYAYGLPTHLWMLRIYGLKAHSILLPVLCGTTWWTPCYVQAHCLPISLLYIAVGCAHQKDTIWNITWPKTNIGESARQKCPGGSEAEGTVQSYTFYK